MSSAGSNVRQRTDSRKRSRPRPALNDVIRALPGSPGVYLFYGLRGELLYVGKSKNIRTRVRSHFSAKEERRMCSQVKNIDIRETAGELGASLLESRLIKELRPLMNVASRERHRIIVARRVDDACGYATARLEAVEYLAPDGGDDIIAVFKHRTQAKEFLTAIAEDFRLCPKLLRLESARGSCFSYHLKKCDGACVGEEPAAPYNARFVSAFAQRRVHAWPHDGGVMVVEGNPAGDQMEVFYIDNWCLLESMTIIAGAAVSLIPGSHRFDYDSYKILHGYFSNPRNAASITRTGRNGFAAAVRKLSTSR